MNMNRRSILSLIGMAPVAAAKVAEDAKAMALAGLRAEPSGGAPSPSLLGYHADAARRSWASPIGRAQIEALLYEQHRVVGQLDHDIASKRSFSLAAKIVFQRQRNVARDIESHLNESPWQRLDVMFRKFAGPLS